MLLAREQNKRLHHTTLTQLLLDANFGTFNRKALLKLIKRAFVFLDTDMTTMPNLFVPSLVIPTKEIS
jgi:hypothetical protein